MSTLFQRLEELRLQLKPVAAALAEICGDQEREADNTPDSTGEDEWTEIYDLALQLRDAHRDLESAIHFLRPTEGHLDRPLNV